MSSVLHFYNEYFINWPTRIHITLKVAPATTERLTHILEQRCTDGPKCHIIIDFQASGYLVLSVVISLGLFFVCYLKKYLVLVWWGFFLELQLTRLVQL